MSDKGVKTPEKQERHPPSDKGRSPPPTRGERTDVTGAHKGKPHSSGQESQPRTSKDYRPGQLENKAGKNIEKERHKHTSKADRAASAEAKAATGKSTKVTGKGVEYHHHAGIKESKRVGLNPNVAGEKNRMSALDSRRNPKNPSTIGDKSDYRKNPARTPHNIAKKIDKTEQERTARAMGKRGDKPQLPKSPEGRKALTDASATSKQRLPATADHAERGKHKWERTQPKGPTVNKRGEVKGSKAEDATAKMEKFEANARKSPAKGEAPRLPKGDGKPTPKTETPKNPKAETPKVPRGEAPRTPPKVETPKTPKPEVPKAGKPPKIDAPKLPPKVDVPKTPKPEAPKPPGRIPGAIGKLAGALGIAGEAIGAAYETREIIAREKPELLPNGSKVPLTESRPNEPWRTRETGYTVEKENDQVIYRNSQGQEVSRDEALKPSPAKQLGTDPDHVA